MPMATGKGCMARKNKMAMMKADCILILLKRAAKILNFSGGLTKSVE